MTALEPPAFFRVRPLHDRFVVTSQQGRFALLDAAELELFRAGRAEPGTPLFERLVAANLLAHHYDVPAAAAELRRRKAFLGTGPNLHILVTTLRCNETCVYCHASRADEDAPGMDMSVETADGVVELAFGSTSPALTFEFQGGEPLLNFPVLQHVVESASARAAASGRAVDFTLVSNLAAMDEEKLAWLIEHRVQICTSVDGPAALHDKQRKLPGASAFAATRGWIRRINGAYADAGLDPSLYHVEALLTTTRQALSMSAEIIDTYVDLGCRALFLRPMDPFGFAQKTGERLGYPVDDFLRFYGQSLDRMIALNREGTEILERFAAIFLTKILRGDDPNYLDIRSPCGAGIGQVAYDYDGRVYTCDEGRMLGRQGDPTFEIGRVGESRYRELMGHETVRAIALASNLDAQPDCVSCAYQPYCGTCPVYNHATQGSLFGRMRESFLCQVHKGIQDALFERLDRGGAEVREVLERWTTSRPRAHFVHGGHAR